MGNKEYKTAKDVMKRAKEAKNVTFEDIFALAKAFQKENKIQ